MVVLRAVGISIHPTHPRTAVRRPRRTWAREPHEDIRAARTDACGDYSLCTVFDCMLIVVYLVIIVVISILYIIYLLIYVFTY